MIPVTPRRASSLPRPPSLRPRRAFTLIELLTVIAIIGILAAILIPVVGKVRESSRTAQCSANIRALGVAATGFRNDYRDATPHFSDRPTLLNGQPVSWYLQLVPYLGGDLSSVASTRAALRTFVCPSSVRARRGETDVPWNGFVAANWPYIADYGFNSRVNALADSPANRRLTRFSDPANPSNTPLIHELVGQNNFYAGTFDFPRPASDEAAFAAGGAQLQAFTQRHGGGGFVLWFDGHVKRLPYADYMARARQDTTPWLFIGGGQN